MGISCTVVLSSWIKNVASTDTISFMLLSKVCILKENEVCGHKHGNIRSACRI